MWLFLTVPWVGLLYVFVVHTDHTHLLHNRNHLETNNKSLIRPLLEYEVVIWDKCTDQNNNALELIQLEAAIISTETTKLVSVANL